MVVTISTTGIKPTFSVEINSQSMTISNMIKALNNQSVEKSEHDVINLTQGMNSDILDYLIVGKVGTEKHRAALKFKIPCVSVEWLVDSVCAGTLLKNVADYPVPPFLGMVIIVSHLKSSDKTQILEKIQSNGGTYSSALVIKEYVCNVTHLVSDSRTIMNTDPEALSDKVKCIINYNKHISHDRDRKAKNSEPVAIVDKSWISDCISRGRWIPEDSYIIIPPVPDTNIMESHTAKEKSAPDASNDTRGSGKTKPVSKLDFNDMNYEDMCELVKRAQEHARGIDGGGGNKRKRGLLTEVVYICGFDDLRIVDGLIRLVCEGHGFRSPVLHQNVTMVVVGPCVPISVLQRIKSMYTIPKCVNIQQLLDIVYK